jgi:hypothetical protein
METKEVKKPQNLEVEVKEVKKPQNLEVEVKEVKKPQNLAEAKEVRKHLNQ